MHIRSALIIAVAASTLARPLQAAPSPNASEVSKGPPHHTPIQSYQIDLRCAGAAAAMATRLPAASPDKKKRNTRDFVAEERTRAIQAGAEMAIAAPDVDRLITQNRDVLLAAAEKPINGAKPSEGMINRKIFLPSLECLLEQMGDAINAAKSKRAN